MTKQEAAETLRWKLTHSRGVSPEARRDLLELADVVVGYPRPTKLATPDRPISGKRIALIVGHNPRAQGAWLKHGTIRESEYVFNGKVAEIVAGEFDGGQVRVFRRKSLGSYSKEIADVYRRVNAWSPDFSQELHFNAGGGDYVSMFIAGSASEASERIAGITHDVFRKGLGLPGRGVLRRTKGQRGGASLYGARGPIVLTEPFFGDDENHCKIVSRLGHQGIARLYLQAIGRCVTV